MVAPPAVLQRTMTVILNVTLPVFAIIALGWTMGRLGVLGDAATEALNKFVYWVALPPALFLATARNPIAEFVNGPFLGAFLGSMLAVFALGALLGRLIHRSPPEVTVMQALNACFSNTGYMGIPLFIAAFGPQGVAPAALATVVMSAVMVGLAVVALELSGASGKGVAAALGDVVRALGRNPLVVAPVAGLALSALGAPLPRPLVTFCEITGAAAGPCALFAIGLFLAGRPLTGQLGEVAWITALKLVVQPALCWWLATRIFAMEPEWAAAAVILAALPTGALTFVVAQQYRTYVEKTSTAILVTTVVSTITLSLVLAAYVPG